MTLTRKKAKSVIESVKHDVLNGMMQVVEVKPKGKMLFEDFLTSYIEDLETGRRTKKGRTVKVTPAYIKGLRIIQTQIRNYQKEMHRKIGLDDMTMETRNSLVGYWKGRGLMPNAINSYMTDVRTVAKAAYEDKLTKCDDFHHSDFVPKKEEVDNILSYTGTDTGNARTRPFHQGGPSGNGWRHSTSARTRN